MIIVSIYTGCYTSTLSNTTFVKWYDFMFLSFILSSDVLLSLWLVVYFRSLECFGICFYECKNIVNMYIGYSRLMVVPSVKLGIAI